MNRVRHLMKNSHAVKIACGIAVGATTIAWVYRDRPLHAAVKVSQDLQPEGSNSHSPPFIIGKSFRPAVPWDSNWDLRDPASLVQNEKYSDDKDDNKYKDALDKAKSKAVRHIILIRHGDYDMKPKDDLFRKLSTLGRQQANLTGMRLKELNLPYTRLVRSSMTRAQETADIIKEHLPADLPLEETDLLREGAPIPPEPPSKNWRPDAYFFADHARIEAAFRKYIHRAPASQEKDSYEVIVCHANVIRYFVCRAIQLPPEAWLRISLRHGSITWLTIRPSGNVSLRTLGDAGFMPADKSSYG